MKEEKFIYSNEINKPLWVIAFSIAIPVTIISLIAIAALLYELIEGPQENPIRSEHLQQHQDDHEKYDRMIEILEEINEKTNEE